MTDLLKYLTDRLTEASTWAALATLLLAAHVSVAPGTWATVTTYGMLAAGAAAVVLKEKGTKPAASIALDVIEELSGELKKSTPPAA